LKADWQRQVLASSGYPELEMFDDAAFVLEEIEPEDKTRNEVLGAHVNLYGGPSFSNFCRALAFSSEVWSGQTNWFRKCHAAVSLNAPHCY
jgi:hypothetical protein